MRIHGPPGRASSSAAISPDNAIIERTFLSINTLFCQYVAGYTGRDVAHRGRDVAAEPLWSPAQLQDLFDLWVILGWQSRPHEGLKSPDTGRVLSPNAMYSVLVAAAGYVPLAGARAPAWAQGDVRRARC